MKVLLVLVVVALAGAATARADVPIPAGFTANKTISAAASFVAGKPVVDYCAASQSAFDKADMAATGDDPGAGYSYVGGTQSFLSPWVCGYLIRYHAGRPVTADQLAKALVVMAHEAELLSGLNDESEADCKALALLPQVTKRYFPLRKPLTMHVVMGDAWDAHYAQPSQYLTDC